MKAVLKDLHSPDEDIQTFEPPDPRDFGLYIELDIGPDSEEGADIFGTMVCSASWYLKEHGEEVSANRRGLVFIDEFNYLKLLQYFQDIVSSYEEDSWQQLASSLNEIFYWEYDNYHPH